MATLLVLSQSAGLVTMAGRPQFYDYIPADVIIAQLIVMSPQRLKELQYMGEMASIKTSSETQLPFSPTGNRVCVGISFWLRNRRMFYLGSRRGL